MEITITEKKEPTLCLNMIVKNESKIIKRLFDSVSPIIDCYCICDTGSTDNTKELITEYFEEKGIPGKIVTEPFINFAHNRNYALQSCVGMSDYVLLLDADMLLDIKPGFNKTMLESYDSFMILQGNESFYYNNMRIIKNNGLYLYIGVTHEYISTPSNNTVYNFGKDVLFITDIGDGGSKANKFERDIELLKKGIEENPNSDRYHFYLANSYFDSGKNVEAIETYKKRIQIGGWNQEVWSSYYKMGMAYKNIGKIEEAISSWLDGYDLLPKRIENLYEIIHHYRNIGKCKSAYAFYTMAKNAIKDLDTKEKDGFLFLKNDIYTYKLEYECSIISCYLSIKNINDQLITIFNNCGENYIIVNTMSNMKFYKDILKPTAVLDLSVSIDHDIAGKTRKFNCSSACIIADNDNYLMNIRMVNYNIDSSGYYRDCDDYIITVNKYIKFTKDFKIIEDAFIDSPFVEKRYIGTEDIRIAKYRSKTKSNQDTNDSTQDTNDSNILFFGTGLQSNGTIGMFYGNYDKNPAGMKSTEIKPTFAKSDCEKNWVFVDIDDETHIIYQWSPLTICKINSLTDSLDLVRQNENVPKIFKHMRGSTNGSVYKNEIWFITHMVSYEQPRHYYHVFVVFDSSMNLLRYSAPFKFEGECIEYCIGLIVEENRVIVPYSTWDRTTKLAIYDKNYINTIVKYT